MTTHIYHYSSYALLGLLPAGILLAPTYSFPVDLALNVVIPYHVYTGMQIDHLLLFSNFNLRLGLTVIVNDYIYAPSASKHLFYFNISLFVFHHFTINN